MKALFLIILILIVVSCQNINSPKESPNSETQTKVEEQNDNQVDPSLKEFSNKINDFLSSKYQKTYEYKSEESRQMIGITFFSRDSIDYYLSSETLPCDIEFYGKAYNQNQGMDPEIDEDENGLSYPATEYIYDQGDYVLFIRVSLDSTLVKIKYVDNETEGTDCAPDTFCVMKETD